MGSHLMYGSGARVDAEVGYGLAAGVRFVGEAARRPDDIGVRPGPSMTSRSRAGELPSVALTRRFLTLCEDYGSERVVVRIVAAGRSTGVWRLPASDDWTAWDAEQMRAAVEYVEHQRSARRPAPPGSTESSGGLRRGDRRSS